MRDVVNTARFPSTRGTPTGLIGGIPELSPARNVIEGRAATAERERLDKPPAVRDMQAALEGSGDPHQPQILKRAVEDFLFSSY